MRSCGICRDVRYVRNVVYRRVIVRMCESCFTLCRVVAYGSCIIWQRCDIWESMEKCWIWESYDIGKIKR